MNAHAKPVVLIAEELSPATIEALGPDFEIRSCNGADRAELLPAIADVDAILVRSATKVDAEALAAARRLKVIARAGVGLDNVDVKAATQAGVMVVNAPTSNIVSAAGGVDEDQARLRPGELVGADEPDRLGGLGQVDAHEVGLGEQLAKVKPSLVLVNAARGGIVDEAALYDALKTGQIAAAGLDVFASEPCTDSPLFELENVVATPHLGASTDEAQEKAGVAVARSVRLALSGELVPDAVNVQGGVIAEDVRPGIPLTEKLGRVFTSLAGEVAQQLDVEVRGEITEYDVKVLELAALKGVFADIVEEQVSYVNAPLLAAERGTEVRLVTEAESPDHRNLITLRGTLADGTQVSVSGTLVGISQKERLVEVNGFDVDIDLTTHLAFFTYEDRPGMVGVIGGILGDAEVNIAGMQVSRQDKGGAALVALSVDSAIPSDTLVEIEAAMKAASVRAVDLS